MNPTRTVKYLRTLEEMQAATVNEIIADGGVPQGPDDGLMSPAEQQHIAFRQMAREGVPGRRMNVKLSIRKAKVGSHAQKALTPEQRRNRAKTNRRNKRKANGGLTTKDAKEVEAFKKFLRERKPNTTFARAYGGVSGL